MVQYSSPTPTKRKKKRSKRSLLRVVEQHVSIASTPSRCAIPEDILKELFVRPSHIQPSGDKESVEASSAPSVMNHLTPDRALPSEVEDMNSPSIWSPYACTTSSRPSPTVTRRSTRRSSQLVTASTTSSSPSPQLSSPSSLHCKTTFPSPSPSESRSRSPSSTPSDAALVDEQTSCARMTPLVATPTPPSLSVYHRPAAVITLVVALIAIVVAMLRIYSA